MTRNTRVLWWKYSKKNVCGDGGDGDCGDGVGFIPRTRYFDLIKTVFRNHLIKI